MVVSRDLRKVTGEEKSPRKFSINGQRDKQTQEGCVELLTTGVQQRRVAFVEGGRASV